MMAEFWIDTHQEIKRRLLDENPKAREVGEKINHINCPSCGKPDAYAYANEPNVIICHRMNQCGEKTLTRHLYEDLFNTFEERFTATETNPRATAEAFLQSRGLDTTRFNFTQGQVSENGKAYPTVKIEFEGVSFQRLIDYQGSNKNRLTAFKGTYFATKSVNQAKQVFLVEGVFDALVLEQIGIPAIANLSSMHNPESCFKEGVSYVLALDNDSAGLKAVRKFRVYLDSKNISYSVSLPPKGKDWNDLLINGDLAEEKKADTLELCKWRGCLAMVSNALDYFKVYCKKSRTVTLFLNITIRLIKAHSIMMKKPTNEQIIKYCVYWLVR